MPAWLCIEVSGARFRTDAGTKAAFSQETVISDNGERARSLLCDREALSNESGEAVGILRASCRFRRKHSVFGVNAQNDVILVHLPYPASQRTVPSATPLRILPSI